MIVVDVDVDVVKTVSRSLEHAHNISSVRECPRVCDRPRATGTLSVSITGEHKRSQGH